MPVACRVASEMRVTKVQPPSPAALPRQQVKTPLRWSDAESTTAAEVSRQRRMLVASEVAREARRRDRADGRVRHALGGDGGAGRRQPVRRCAPARGAAAARTPARSAAWLRARAGRPVSGHRARACRRPRRHRDIVARLGRQPHRNEALGRSSTPEEAAYVATGEFVHHPVGAQRADATTNLGAEGIARARAGSTPAAPLERAQQTQLPPRVLGDSTTVGRAVTTPPRPLRGSHPWTPECAPCRRSSSERPPYALRSDVRRHGPRRFSNLRRSPSGRPLASGRSKKRGPWVSYAGSPRPNPALEPARARGQCKLQPHPSRWIHISSATPRLAAKASIGVR